MSQASERTDRRMRRRRLAAPPAVALAAAALAAAAGLAGCRTGPPADVPGEFTFHGLAVHPAAIAALYNSTSGEIDLATFKTNLEERQWEDQPGWWVTDYDEDVITGRSPFFAYAAFAGPVNGASELYVLSVTFNQGETADIDNIILLQKAGAWLSLVRVWSEGSACNGGILNQRMEDDKFFYSRELTPVGLLELSLDTPFSLAPNQDLEATSESCFATANFVYDLTQDFETLSSVRLYDEPVEDEKGRTEGLRYQSCFNRIFNDYVKRGQLVLTAKDVEDFAARFKKECLAPAGAVPPDAAPVDK
jgi:hypothetical protein